MTERSATNGRSSRKRQTPLRSTADWERRRWRQVDFSSSALGLASFQPGYVISSRSPQLAQRKFWAASSLRLPQAMQRKRKSVERGFRDTSGVEVGRGGISSILFLFPEILVGLVDPIGAGRIEDVEVDGICERFGF